MAFSDSFTYSDGSLSGESDWNTQSGTFAFTIDTNQVHGGVGGGFSANYVDSGTSAYDDDQQSEIEVDTVNDGDARGGAGVRMGNSGSAGGYFHGAWGAGSALFNIDSGTDYVIDPPGWGSGTGVSGGDVIGCEAEGTTIRGLVNDSLALSATDSGASSGQAGIGLRTVTNDDDVIYDNFDSSDLGGAAASLAVANRFKTRLPHLRM